VNSVLCDLPKKYQRKSHNNQINSNIKKRRSFLVLLCAAGYLKRLAARAEMGAALRECDACDERATAIAWLACSAKDLKFLLETTRSAVRPHIVLQVAGAQSASTMFDAVL
jgi:hypothetical protein